MASPTGPGVFHCFTESMQVARAALDLGYYISFSGIVTFKSAQELRDVVAFVPLDRMLIETDSPYLAPVPYRGKTNNPSYVPYVARQVAETKGIALESVAEATSHNFNILFKGWRYDGLASARHVGGPRARSLRGFSVPAQAGAFEDFLSQYSVTTVMPSRCCCAVGLIRTHGIPRDKWG